jgi:UDP-N-acetylglucosamine transferase subunit ALG13
MIFVTVGTHEDPFDRLVKAIDRLKGAGAPRQEVFIQTGYSTYKPEFCRYEKFIPFDEMMQRMAEAEIVITHGGTGSIMLALYHGKAPIVVPRQKKYNEHIDDHQVLFCKRMETKKKIIAVYETAQLQPALDDYPRYLREMNVPAGSTLEQNAAIFAGKLHAICTELMVGKKRKKTENGR